MNHGMKISAPNIDVEEARLNDLMLSSKYPLLKCDFSKTPKPYGIIKCTFGLAVGETKTLYSIPHGYNYVPVTLISWHYPGGSRPGVPQENSTYGSGEVFIYDPTAGGLIQITFQANSKTVDFVAVGIGMTNPATNLYIECKYYIFADDFPLYSDQPGSYTDLNS